MIYLSIVIPSVRPGIELLNLIGQILNIDGIEIIIINQSGHSILEQEKPSNKIIEIVLAQSISASAARNKGALASSADFIFFLDDDAKFLNNSELLLPKLVNFYKDFDFIVFDRGIETNGNYKSLNPKKNQWSNKHWDLIKFITEWNICIRKSSFFAVNGFPLIGVGSNHMALSGEVFGIISQSVIIKLRFQYFDEVKIAHPPPWTTKPLEICIGYYYGAGYSIGLSIKKFSFKYRFLWYTRTVLASARDLFCIWRRILRPNEKIYFINYRMKISIARIRGLRAGMEGLPPASINSK